MITLQQQMWSSDQGCTVGGDSVQFNSIFEAAAYYAATGIIGGGYISVRGEDVTEIVRRVVAVAKGAA